jgi:hypothetical protein
VTGRRGWAGLLAALLLLGGVGCGDDAGTRAEPLGRWVRNVCGALADFNPRFDTARDEAQAEFNAIERQDPAAIALDDVRRTLVAAFDGLRDVAAAVTREIAAAGTPDVDNGTRIASTFRRAFGGLRDALGRAADDLSRLPLDPTAFEQGLSTVQNHLDRAESDSQARLATLDTVDSARFNAAAARVQECEGVLG